MTLMFVVIKDEKHILLHCLLYDLYRKQLYDSVNELCPNSKDLNTCTCNGEQLNYLLNTNGLIVKAVARLFYMYLTNSMHSSVINS